MSNQPLSHAAAEAAWRLGLTAPTRYAVCVYCYTGRAPRILPHYRCLVGHELARHGLLDPTRRFDVQRLLAAGAVAWEGGRP